MLLAHLFALALGYIYPLLAARKDAIMIASHDTINHTINVVIRVAVFGFTACAAFLPIAVLQGKVFAGILLVLSYNVMVAAIFWVVFDRRLNRLRGLDGSYISVDPQGAETDQLIVRISEKTGYEIYEVAYGLKLSVLGLATIIYAMTGYNYFYL